MGTYDNVGLSLLQVGKNLFLLFRCPCSGQVIHTDREVFQAVFEGVEMLVCQYCSRHEQRHLLAVRSSLERRPYRNLGLAESHVAAYKAVHGLLALHVFLHIL